MAEPKERQHGDETSSSKQIEENATPGDLCELDGDAAPRNVSTHASGAKRGSFFRNRDYRG